MKNKKFYVKFYLPQGTTVVVGDIIEQTDESYYTTVPLTKDDIKTLKRAVHNFQQKLMIRTGVKSCYININPKDVVFLSTFQGGDCDALKE